MFKPKLPNYGKIDLGDPRIRSTKSLEYLVGEVFPSMLRLVSKIM